MHALLLLLFWVFPGDFQSSELMIDFGTAPEKCKNWVLVSDNVMGGVSKSTLEYTENSILLSGSISLENFGGFSSIRTEYNKIDLSDYKSVTVRLKASGQKFSFTLEDNRFWFRPYYKGAINLTEENVWQEITVNFTDFKQYSIGDATGEGMKAGCLKNIVRMGLVTTLKKEGPFSLEVDYIRFNP